jgi:hypothetical protein
MCWSKSRGLFAWGRGIPGAENLDSCQFKPVPVTGFSATSQIAMACAHTNTFMIVNEVSADPSILYESMNYGEVTYLRATAVIPHKIASALILAQYPGESTIVVAS